jgi:hypothetical protein
MPSALAARASLAMAALASQTRAEGLHLPHSVAKLAGTYLLARLGRLVGRFKPQGSYTMAILVIFHQNWTFEGAFDRSTHPCGK